jgi:hypothetical protein
MIPMDWRPADEAPELVPLLCYWCPWPNGPSDECKPEFWAVGVRWSNGGFTRWSMYHPMGEGGVGMPHDCAPDYFLPLPSRPKGSPKWVTEGEVVNLVADDGEILDSANLARDGE